MPFCNSCGTQLAAASNVCSKCGAPLGGAAGLPAAPAQSPSSPASASPLKIVLIVFFVIVGIGILGLATLGIVGYRMAKSARVSQDGGQVKIESPFGTIESSKDPQQAVRELGVDVYPGSQVQGNNASTTTVGAIHTVTAFFQSSDPVAKVCGFYSGKLAPASVTETATHCTIASKNSQNVATVNIESSGEGSRFQITTVTKSPSPNR